MANSSALEIFRLHKKGIINPESIGVLSAMPAEYCLEVFSIHP